MINSIGKSEDISRLFDDANLVSSKIRGRSILIKINLTRPPEKNFPRTDAILLKKVVEYLVSNGAEVSVGEGADGHLDENLQAIGLLDFMTKNGVGIVDLDEADATEIVINGQTIYVPDLLERFDYRISIPCTSKREEMLYTSNIKNFFGATPRRYYLEDSQDYPPSRWRIKLHHALHESVCNVYLAMEQKAKFHYYINGGNSYSEKIGEFEFDKYFISDNAIELDDYIYKKYFSNVDRPEYLDALCNKMI